MSIEKLLEKEFTQHFNKPTNAKLFFAPGRVNLIGEHIDYNGGNVFPCALDIGTYALVQPRNDKLCRFYSINFESIGIIEFSLSNLEFDSKHNWANYPKGVIVEFVKRNISLTHGFDIVFYGNIPNGAGLSSSASIEVLMGTIINVYTGNTVDSIQVALLGRAAENNYINVGCGIMDQFASAMGKKDHAILLNCNTLNYQYAPFKLDGYKIVIANSNKRRGLADSKYNERLAECNEALAIVKQQYPEVDALCNLNITQLNEIRNLFDNEVIYRRALHAVSENQRTLDAVTALNNNDLVAFGKLMADSHNSLRDYYEVTGRELDSLVSNAWLQNGCVGARMTGAGFGGCTVNLVKSDLVDDFIAQVGNNYSRDTGLTAEFYVVSPSGGACELV